uniref:NADH dehydrogense subunit 4L n=1 Tax=Leptotrombidium akamushi TaxID=299468 RepID=Q3C2J0_9ACAR|nr:NADH dehydrogenase subunit 4L [Leptotrombidium akamushi]BAE47107.1 NADH dehydrogense subunit 4L [Leptotrombidium akamushi]
MMIFEFVFLSGTLVIMFFKHHYLLILLFLELLMVSLFFGLCLVSFMFESFIFLFIMLVLEGAFGLSVLINNSRGLGGDFFSKAII